MSRPRAFGPSPLADLHPAAALFEAYLRSLRLRPALADIPGAPLAEAEDFLRGRPVEDRLVVLQHAVLLGPLVPIG
jgi:hypothetical protein